MIQSPSRNPTFEYVRVLRDILDVNYNILPLAPTRLMSII